MRNRTLLAILAIVLAAILAYALWPESVQQKPAKVNDTAQRNPVPSHDIPPEEPAVEAAVEQVQA